MYEAKLLKRRYYIGPTEQQAVDALNEGKTHRVHLLDSLPNKLAINLLAKQDMSNYVQLNGFMLIKETQGHIEKVGNIISSFQ